MTSVPPAEWELRLLPRGRGVHADNIDKRLGPALTAACSITDRDDVSARKRKLVRRLLTHAAGLQEDLRISFLAAVAVQQETIDMRFLDERVRWLQKRLSCSERTARRRIQEAIRQVGRAMDHLLENPPDPSTDSDHGWYVESLKSLVALDGPTPRSTEERRIVSTVDDLVEIVHRASVPRSPASPGARRLEVDLLHGGELRLAEAAGGHFSYLLTLPERLNTGDHHEYTVQMHVPPGQQMLPRYLCTPLRRHDLFTLRIRFAPDSLPTRIWRVTEAAPHTLDGSPDRWPTVRPNRFGEVQAEFRNLRVGFAYGIEWAN